MTRDQVDIVLIAVGWAAAVGVLGLLHRLCHAQAVVPVADHAGRSASRSSPWSPVSSAPPTRCSCPTTTSRWSLLVCLVAGVVAVLFALGLAAPPWYARSRRAPRAPRDASARPASTRRPTADRPSCSELSAELARTSERLRESRDREQRLEESRRRAGRLGVARPAQPAGGTPGDDRGSRGRHGRRARSATTADALRGRPHGAHGRRPVRALADPRRAAAAVAAERGTRGPRVRGDRRRGPRRPGSRRAARRIGRPGRDGAGPTRPGCPAWSPTWSPTPSGTRRPTGSCRSPAEPSTTASSCPSPTAAAASPRTTCLASSTSPGAAAHARTPEVDQADGPAPGSAWPSSRASSRLTTAWYRSPTSPRLPVPGASACLTRRVRTTIVATVTSTVTVAISAHPATYGRSSRVGLSGRAPNRPSTGIASRVTEPSTTSATARRRPPGLGEQPSRPRPASTITTGASTRSCSTTPPTSQVATSTRSTARVVEQQQPAVRRGGDAGERRAADAGHASTSSRLDPLGLQHARPVGRDDPARVAVVDVERLARQLEREQGRGRRRRSSRAGSSRGTGHSAAARSPRRRCRPAPRPARAGRGPGPRSTARSRSTPRHRRSAAPRWPAPCAASSSRGELDAPGRRTPPSAGTPGPGPRSVTRAATADLLIGTPCGPSPDRTAEHRHVAQPATVLPAVATTATPAAAQVARSSPRRDRPRATRPTRRPGRGHRPRRPRRAPAG